MDAGGTLESFCAKERFGYVPLSEHLLEANRSGRPTGWSHDAHFNEIGNEVVAEAMYDWMLTHARADGSPYSPKDGTADAIH